MTKSIVYVDTKEKPYVHIAIKKAIHKWQYKDVSLPIGDIVVGNFIIERKQVNDLYKSLFDGRLYDQIDNLLKFKEDNPDAILIILVEDGKISKHYKDYALLWTVELIIINIMHQFNIFTVRTRNTSSTATFIKECASYSIKDNVIRKVRGYKRQKTIFDHKQFFLMGLPSIGETKSLKILSKNKTVMDFLESQKGKSNKTSKILYSENKQ